MENKHAILCHTDMFYSVCVERKKIKYYYIMSRYFHWETCQLSLCSKTESKNPSASVGIYDKFYPPNEIK